MRPNTAVFSEERMDIADECWSFKHRCNFIQTKNTSQKLLFSPSEKSVSPSVDYLSCFLSVRSALCCEAHHPASRSPVKDESLQLRVRERGGVREVKGKFVEHLGTHQIFPSSP